MASWLEDLGFGNEGRTDGGVSFVPDCRMALDMDSPCQGRRLALGISESTVLKVEMTDECLNTIKSARTELIKAETTLLANHRRMMLQEIRNQNEEMQSFIKSGKGVFLPPKVFWWWAGITYLTSLYSLWGLLQLILQWLKC